MSLMLPRHGRRPDPGAGLLRAEHFQMGYVTNDLDRARALFADLGVPDFRRLEGRMPRGGAIRADFAWVGPLMYELIEATGDGSDVYDWCLPDGDGFHLRHHHLGYLVETRARWDALIAQAAAAGWAMPYRNANPLLEACFVQVPGLPHYLEYLLPEPAGLDFFDSVPRH